MAATNMMSMDEEKALEEQVSSKQQIDDGENRKPERHIRKWRRLAAGISCLVAIGLAVGLSVGLSSNNNRSSGESESLSVPPAPQDLAELCSKENIQDGGAAAACEEVCEPASCCYAGGESQCSHPNCHDYSVCFENLHNKTTTPTTPQPTQADAATTAPDTEPPATAKPDTVPSAPANIQDLCSTENLAAGGSPECTEACEPGLCCVAIGNGKCSHENCEAYQEACTSVFIQDTNSMFPYSKAFVDTACSLENAGSDECEQACVPADCCNPSETSCLQSDTKSCFNYAKCQSLETGMAAAPKNLGDICSREEIEKDPTPCEDACEAIQCCYKEDLECPASMFLACLDFLECQNLREDAALPVAPASISNACNPIWGDRDECEQICEAAECCLGDLSAFTDSCLKTDFPICLSYAPCGTLLLPEPNSKVDPPPSNLDEVCSLGYIDGNGCDDCDDACEAAECCDELSLTGNCFLQDPFGCLEYGPCALRYIACGTVPFAPHDLHQTCSVTELEKNGRNVEACVDACEPANCCLEEKEDNCLKHNAISCASYAACLNLYVAGGDLEDPPSDLSTTCANDISACVDLCNEEADCCYSLQEDNCLVGNINTCASWLSGGCWRVPGFVF